MVKPGSFYNYCLGSVYRICRSTIIYLISISPVEGTIKKALCFHKAKCVLRFKKIPAYQHSLR